MQNIPRNPVSATRTQFPSATNAVLEKIKSQLADVLQLKNYGTVIFQDIAHQAHELEYHGDQDAAHQIDIALIEAALELELSGKAEMAKVIYIAINNIPDNLVRGNNPYRGPRNVEAGARLESLGCSSVNDGTIVYDGFCGSRPALEQMQQAADSPGRRVAQYCFGLKCFQEGDHLNALKYLDQSAENGYQRANDEISGLLNGPWGTAYLTMNKWYNNLNIL